MTEIKRYLVGGAVRDELLGIASKDLDYTVTVGGVETVEDAWNAMREQLISEGFKIFLETPQYFTIRAKFPKGHAHEKIVGDFVLAREEGSYSDSRRPDWVRPGTLEQDLGRRDFTVNALARAEDGTLIDLFNGQTDLERRVLVAVGDPRERLLEDPLRVFRALRFAVTKGFHIGTDLKLAIWNVGVQDALDTVSVDRIREELHRCFAHDTVGTVKLISSQYPFLLNVIDRKGIWFEPTNRSKK